MDVLSLDTSVSDANIGSLFSPWDESPVGSANARVARIFKVAKSVITTNGTTASNFLCLYTLLSPGDQVVVARDSHSSVIQSLNLIGAHPIWMKSEYDANLGITLDATVTGIRDALQRAPDAKAVILTSPKYFGIVGGLDKVIAECHLRNLPVMVDTAHGPNFPFHDSLPMSAVEAGADLVTLSPHKSTAALSQGSIVLINSPDQGLHDAFLDAIRGTPAISTSFSFPILASVEEAVDNLDRYGYRNISAAIDLAEDFRNQLRSMTPIYRTWGVEQAGRPGFAKLDPTRVTVDVSGTGLTGIEVERLMQQERPGLPPVVAELGDQKNVLFLVTWGNDGHEIDAAVAHLQHIAVKCHGRRRSALRVPLADLPPQAMPPCAAQWSVKRGNFRVVDGRKSIGQVSGETVAVYPPGWPVVIQGEYITPDIYDFLRESAEFGANLKGASNNFETVKVML